MPDPATVPPPAKKPRKAKQPKAPRAPRKPSDTIHTWLRAQGEAHVEAARILGPAFVKDLRAERGALADLAAATIEVGVCRLALAAAENQLVVTRARQSSVHEDRIHALAKSIATARGEVPHPDDALPVEPDAPTA